MLCSLYSRSGFAFLYLPAFQLNLGAAVEDHDGNGEFAPLLVDLFHKAVAAVEGAVRDLDAVTDHKRDPRRDTFLRGLELGEHFLGFTVSESFGFVTAEKADHAVGLLHQLPGFAGHFHINENISGIEFARVDALLAVPDILNFFGGHDDFRNVVAHAVLQYPFVELLLSLEFLAGKGIQHIPLVFVFFFLRSHKILLGEFQKPGEKSVQGEKVRRHDERADYDDLGGGPELFPAGPVDLLQFLDDFAPEIREPLPGGKFNFFFHILCVHLFLVARQERLELPTDGFGNRNSSQLSYCPAFQGKLFNYAFRDEGYACDRRGSICCVPDGP